MLGGCTDCIFNVLDLCIVVDCPIDEMVVCPLPEGGDCEDDESKE